MINSYTIADCRALAESRGGHCLSHIYVNARAIMHWQCAVGHTWKTRSANVRDGHWCPRCSKVAVNAPRRLSLKLCQRLAKQRGGRCLSTEYRGAEKPLRWRCADGHEWEAPLDSIKNRETWCGTCAGVTTPLTLQDMQRLAHAHGGRCLSREYVNVKTKLRWECRRGHRWWALPSSVKRSHSWCPRCAKHSSRRERSLFREVEANFPSALHNVRGLLRDRRFELDIYVPELRAAIEFDGTYWHSLPGAMQRDRRKDQQCLQAGIALLRIPEQDYLYDRRDVRRRIVSFLKTEA